MGRAFLYSAPLPLIQPQSVPDPEPEIERLNHAIETVDRELSRLEADTEKRIGRTEAEVFSAHRLILKDPSFRQEIEQIIRSERIQAESAVQRVTGRLKAMFESMENDYFRARSVDVADVGARLLRTLLGIASAGWEQIHEPVVVVADELLPSDTAQMDPSLILGIVTAGGGPSSHVAILARSLGIPAVVDLGPEVLTIRANTLVIVDGHEGWVILDPDTDTQQTYLQRRQEHQARLDQALKSATQPVILPDGTRVIVAANIGSVQEAKRVIPFGGEGVGLLRTEFLFLDRAIAPTEDEQYEAYVIISNLIGNQLLIVRTLDIGGDKSVSYLSLPQEANPFLGKRGLRFLLDQPDLFKTQLRAILRAAHERQIAIMFPMVTTHAELLAARAMLEEARQELLARSQPIGQPQIGIMVEVPAAALCADILATEVDFLSIGTNDLAQYTLAIDRTNPSVRSIADHFHPAVLRLIYQTIQQAHAKGIWVGLCGELAGEVLAAPLLLGMGLDEFSMAPASIPFVKETLRRWSREEAAALVEPVLAQRDSAAVIAFLQERKK